MKVIEILKQSADLLGLAAESVKLSTEDQSQEEVLLANSEISSLYNLFKFSAREVCTNYVPICVREQITTQNLKYSLNNLTNYIRMVKVIKGEQNIPYKILNRMLVFEEEGTFDVEYLSYPEIRSLFEDIDFLSNFSSDVLIYGLCAYYSLAHGLFAEFESFHDNYIERAESLKELKLFTMPQRRWQ